VDYERTKTALQVENPKLRSKESAQSVWYKYYPSFSESFAESILSSIAPSGDDWILDPWNGSGTTTSKAVSLGLNACGYDLNPVMVIVAKARCLDAAEFSSLKPLSVDLLSKSRSQRDISADDPLLAWLLPESVSAVRSIEAGIQKLLVDDKKYLTVKARGTDAISDLAAFFYVALFRALRQILRPFQASNPTWLKRPASKHHRLRPNGRIVRAIFRAEISKILPTSAAIQPCVRGERILTVASSDNLPLGTASVTNVLSSPPYCTRIDYAVATSAELSLLGFALESDFRQLRKGLIGSSTVPKVAPTAAPDWGETCLCFLDRLRTHPSKASATYYYKNHLQYFNSISSSLSEIGRVLTPGGKCILVVQDSYYKDLHNNLPLIFTEMAHSKNLVLEDKRDFPLTRTMAGINPKVNGYRRSFSAVESVLVLAKPRPSGAHKVNHNRHVV
jgi:SAM-dependent methyltransferase